MPLPLGVKIGATVLMSPQFQKAVSKVGTGMTGATNLKNILQKLPEEKLKQMWGDRYPLLKQWLAGDISQEEMESQYQKGLEEGIYTEPTTARRSEELDQLIQRYTSFKAGDQKGQYLQRLAAQQAAAEQRAQQALAMRYAAATGGRTAAPQREAAPTGRGALAQQMGTAAVSDAARQQENAMKLAGLRAYVDKYGMDQNAMLAMQRLNLQGAMEQSAYWRNIMGNVGQGLAQYAVPWMQEQPWYGSTRGGGTTDKFAGHTGYY